MAERGKSATTSAADGGPTQSAEYIADLTDELAKLARRSRLDVLAYLLDIASLEAKTVAGQHASRPGRRAERMARAAQG